MNALIFLLGLCFFTGCAPKGVDSCQFNTTIYGQIIKHKDLPIVMYIDHDFPSDYYEDLMGAVEQINRDRKYIVIYKGTTDKMYNYTNEIILQANWRDDQKESQGVTSLWYSSSGRIQEADIQINVDDYNYMNGGYSFKTLITHELLHALGMLHQQDDKDGVLYPYLSQYQTRGMTEREYKNLECAYGK